MSEPPEYQEMIFPGPRTTDAHKGDFGRVLIVAGSPGLTGAAYLAGKAAIRTGSGLVTVAVPESLNEILETKTTCVMTLPVPEHAGGSFTVNAVERILGFAEKCDSVGLGPGIGRESVTRDFILKLVESIQKPTVIDADGLYHLEGNLNVLKKAAGPRILTPHPGEFARLLGLSISDVQSNREKTALEFAKEYEIVCVLKGHMTVITDGKITKTNTTGNPGMATGGTGDVLTGVIASLLGHGIPAFESARSGVYLHGLAGDIASETFGEHSMIASDLLDTLPQAVKRCFRKN